MNTYVCLLALASVAAAQPFLPVLHRAAPVPAPVVPITTSSQFHSQDELGQYSYGYNDGNSAKVETKDAFGITRGSYSYVAPDGQVIQNSYVADENGFRSSLAPSDGNAGPLVARVPAPVVSINPAHIPTPVVKVSSAPIHAPLVQVSPASIPAPLAQFSSAPVHTPVVYSPYNYGLGAGYRYNVPWW